MIEMKLSSALCRYLSQQFIRNLFFMSAVLLLIVYLFDTVELLRRASRNDSVSFGLVLKMGLLKLPEIAEVISPFIILFTALFTFWVLGRRQELTALRAAGVSVWQFLTPIMGSAMLFGVVLVVLINPLGAIFVSKFNNLQDLYLERQSAVALFEDGLWLRQGVEPGTGGMADDGYIILQAQKIKMPEWRLNQVMVLFFNDDDQVIKRIDADTARLTRGAWVFSNAVVTETRGGVSEQQLQFMLPTILTAQDIEESFSSPESIGFWSLPSFIHTLDVTGFDSTRLRIHFHKLLALPFLFGAMILLAASVSLRPSRQGGTFRMILFGVGSGFIIFFSSSFVQALGASHQLPVFLAAWSPALVTFLAGTTALMIFEDG